MVQRQREILNTVQRIRTGSKHIHIQLVTVDGHGEFDLGTIRLSEPIALHGQNTLGPAMRQRIQILQQGFFKRSDPEKPLFQLDLLNLCAGTP